MATGLGHDFELKTVALRVVSKLKQNVETSVMMHMEVVVLHIGHSPKDVSDGTNAGDGAGQLINGEAVHKSVLGEEVEHDYFLLGKQGQKDFFGDVFVEDQFVLAGFLGLEDAAAGLFECRLGPTVQRVLIAHPV